MKNEDKTEQNRTEQVVLLHSVNNSFKKKEIKQNKKGSDLSIICFKLIFYEGTLVNQKKRHEPISRIEKQTNPIRLRMKRLCIGINSYWPTLES
jgi:hypothetical protein